MADTPTPFVIDASGLVMLEAMAVRMVAAQADGSARFAGGNEVGSGWLDKAPPTSGRFEARYDAAQSIPATIRAAIGLSRIPSSTTTETVHGVEERVRGVLRMLATLAH